MPRNVVLSVVSLTVALLAGEAFLRVWYLDGFWRPESATWRLLRQASQRRLTVTSGATQIVSSKPLYRVDPLLGWSVNPGEHDIELKTGGKSWTFHASADSNGRRATGASPAGSEGAKPIWIFGDSVVWGWPLSDEQTFPWLLQERAGERAHVTNFAVPGYGNVHALLELRRQLDGDRRPAVVVIAYGEYFQIRNSATPIRLRQIRLVNPELAGARHPRGYLDSGGELAIDYLPFPSAEDAPLSKAHEPPQSEQDMVTIEILGEIKELIDEAGAVAVIAYLQGSDTSPVLRSVREQGFVVADLRLAPSEGDNAQPFDPHPGVLSHRNYARKLSAVLDPIIGGHAP